jgi:putative hydrolase of the HAD superfamily
VAEERMTTSMKKNYTCVLFDLDHTLWDYELNSKETLHDLYHGHDLLSKGVPDFDSFHKQFRIVNTELWELYDTGKIDSHVIRNERFRKILQPFFIFEEKLCQELSHDYLNQCPTKGNLMPDALKVLDYLNAKYKLTIVTNGFEEIQNLKLSSSQITTYFPHVITSQKAGCKKPAKEIFHYALKMNGAECHEAIMIGDNLVTDIGGAKNASLDTVFFNPDDVKHEVSVTHEIKKLTELLNIL